MVLLSIRDSSGVAGDGAVASSGTDDAAQSAQALRVGAGTGLELQLTPGGGSVYVSGPAGGTVDLVLARVG